MNRYFLIAALLLCLVSCRTEVQQRVYGRYVPERKDDFAWENEYAAFRLYGPALAPENPSNGVDLWLKNSPALVIDTMYGRELRDNRPYHINYDGNLDCYKVAHTAGCGGVVILAANGQEPTANGLSIGGPYSSWEILEQTADKFPFFVHIYAAGISRRHKQREQPSGCPRSHIPYTVFCTFWRDKCRDDAHAPQKRSVAQCTLPEIENAKL